MKFPGDTDRVTCLGRTGSGKTTFAMWLLSGCDFNAMPAVIYNTKGDKLINEVATIPGVKTIDINETPGDKGLFIYNPTPDQQDEIDASFRRIWMKQNIRVFVDEGYMIELDDGFNALLTQGRSRNIPLIVCSQRPSWISKYVFSEADFYAVFNLQILSDRKKVAEFVPVDVNYRLPKHHCFWYEVGEHTLYRLAPVNASTIVDNFRKSFPPPEGEQFITGPASPIEFKQVPRKVVI